MTSRRLSQIPREVHIGALSPDLLGDDRRGAALLEALFTRVPQVAPDSIGNHEPIRTSYDKERWNLASWWRYPFLWKRKRPRTLGRVWMDDARSHTCMLVDVQGHVGCGEAATTALRTIASFWNLDFGYVHASGRVDEDRRQVPIDSVRWRRSNPYVQGVMTKSIQGGLPGFCWAMLFGPPYVSLFGRERMASIPANTVEEIDTDVFLVQLTSTLDHYDTDREQIVAMGERAMSHLGYDAFIPESNTDRMPRRLPGFDYGRR